jgi:hypothetical protein
MITKEKVKKEVDRLSDTDLDKSIPIPLILK